MTDAVPYPEYLAELVARLRAVAGERLVGAWLVGSAALGDFDPARSDLDVQAVTAERLSRVERRLIVDTASHDALPCPVRGLELVLYAREELAIPAYELNLNTGPRMERRVSYDAGRGAALLVRARPRDRSRARDRARRAAEPRGHSGAPARVRAGGPPRGADVVRGRGRRRGAVRAGGVPGVGVGERRRLAIQGRRGELGAGALPDPDPVDRALAHRDDPAAPPPSAREREALVSCALAAA